MQQIVIKTNPIKVKKPAGIDFNIPVKKKEKKAAEVTSEPVYLEEHYAEFRESKNSKIFKEIVDMMMLEYFDESFKKKIKGLSDDKKRMMILALLDKERNLFMKAKALIPDNYKKVPKLQHIKELILILREYVHVGEVEKKKHGEVMTPLELVKEMLLTLPKKVWSNPHLKWLDSCNGTGPFLAMVVFKLMQGLAQWEPDEDKRYKHIMENMIYAGELQAKNMFLWITLMDPYNELKLNVYCGSFLDSGFDKHMKEVWGVNKFDIIIGNPPYQHPTNKRWKLWISFIEKICSLNNDYLLFVNPISWVNGVGEELDKARTLILEKGLVKVNPDVNHHFIGIGENIGYFLCNGEKNEVVEVIQNDDKYFITINDGKIHINDDDKLKDEIYNKLSGYKKFTFNNINTDIKSKVANETFTTSPTISNKYKVIHSASNIFYCSDDVCKTFQKEGIIINWSGYSYKKDDGKYLYRSIEDVPGRNTKKIFTNSENESNNLIDYIKSDLIQFFVNSKKTSGFNSPLFDIPLVDIKEEWNNDKIYNFFGITENEINYISKYLKNK